jgi:hypothetical protein
VSEKPKRSRLRVAPHPMALSYTIDDAQTMCGLGRTTLYKLAQQGQLRLVRVYGRTLVCGDSLRALLGVAKPLEARPAPIRTE